jgi:hypothetical protein
LTSLSDVAINKVEVNPEIPDSITSALFFVNIIPRTSSVPVGPRSVQVRVTSGREVIAESETVTVGSESKKVRIVLHKLPEEVQISVIDSDTREVIAARTASVHLAGYDEDI